MLPQTEAEILFQNESRFASLPPSSDIIRDVSHCPYSVVRVFWERAYGPSVNIVFGWLHYWKKTAVLRFIWDA